MEARRRYLKESTGWLQYGAEKDDYKQKMEEGFAKSAIRQENDQGQIKWACWLCLSFAVFVLSSFLIIFAPFFWPNASVMHVWSISKHEVQNVHSALESTRWRYPDVSPEVCRPLSIHSVLFCCRNVFNPNLGKPNLTQKPVFYWLDSALYEE